MNFDLIKEFPVTVFGNLTPINNTISQARVRIFYKGLNRNGTYITDEFAETLVQSLPYSPVKGIYDGEGEDFTDHGKKRTQGQAYGVVAANPNFAWEKHLDEDGVEREYACADVILWTALYEEANEIVGKSQSMELYEPSILGEWKVMQGRRVFVFKEASFLGLQVLGDGVEPCFEGSAFFSLYSSLKEMVEEIKQFNLNSQKEKKGGENQKMPSVIFKLSDEQKRDKLFVALNPEQREFTLYPVATYDDHVIVHSWEDEKYFNITYTMAEDGAVTFGEKKEVFAEFVTAAELNALNALRAINGGTYEAIDTNYTTLQTERDDFSQKAETFSTKVSEHEGTIATLTTDKQNAETSLHTAQARVTELEGEVESLNSFKLKKEKEEKDAVITKYSEQLSKDVISQYNTDERLAEFTAETLEKELAFQLVQSNPGLFTQNPQYVPKDNGPKSGIEGILAKYRDKQ